VIDKTDNKGGIAGIDPREAKVTRRGVTIALAATLPVAGGQPGIAVDGQRAACPRSREGACEGIA